MNENPKLPDKSVALQHLVGLRYLLAGDFESEESLCILENRITRDIDWDSESFREVTSQARVGVEDLPPELQERGRKVSPEALLDFVNQHMGRSVEISQRALDSSETAAARITQNNETMHKLLTYIEETRLVFAKAIDRLQTLGVGDDEFQLPVFRR